MRELSRDEFVSQLNAVNQLMAADITDLLAHDAALRAQLATAQQTIQRLEQRIEDERHAHRDTANERNKAEYDLAALRAAPSRTWSRERPSIDGTYWLIESHKKHFPPFVVAVEDGAVFFTSGRLERLIHVTGEWAGPIDSPLAPPAPHAGELEE